MKIKKNDTVKMIAGKDSGKTGKVLQAFPDGQKIIVEGLNIIKKHKRARSEKEKGQRLEIPRRVPVSDAILICPKCGKPTRVGYKLMENGKSRMCKKCQAEF